MTPRPERKVKVGVRIGGGPPPGYQWHVGLIDFVVDEAMGFLVRHQYRHLSMQMRELARSQDPTHSATISLDKIEDIFEMRDKGGALGNLNVRVFFGVDDERRCIVVLGSIQKKNDGQTPMPDKVRMRRRWRKYKNGDYGFLEFETSGGSDQS